MSHVVFALEGGRRVRLAHGQVIGRSPTAALVLDDLRISGLHAQVELRPDGLALLALRGAVRLHEQPVHDTLLATGQRFELGGAVWLEVVEVDHGTGAVALPPTEPVEVGSLELVAQFDSAVLSGAGLEQSLVITGLKGLLLVELVRAGEPVHWHRVARRLWPMGRGQDPREHKEAVRARWYQLTARLRRELAAAGLERDLVVARGGAVRLALIPGDRVENASD